MKNQWRPLLSLVIPFVLTLTFSYYLQYLVVAYQQEFTQWLAQFGPFVIIVYFILQATTIVFAPIGGFFLVVTMIALFGLETALIAAYLAGTPVYVLNFYLAKRYGRPFVIKMIGEEPLKKLDHLVKDSGFYILIMTRVLQAANFDYLSYVWGLTRISFKTFILVNFIAGIPGMFLTYLIMRSFDNLTYAIIAFYLLTAVFGAIAIYLTHFMKKHKRF